MTLSELLTHKMIDYGYGSARELGRALGIHPYYAYRLLDGTCKNPGMKLRVQICKELDVDMEVLKRAVKR